MTIEETTPVCYTHVVTLLSCECPSKVSLGLHIVP